MRITFTLQRYNPEKDSRSHAEDYRLDVSRAMTVLEALIRIKDTQDGSLSLRYSCRSAICGSCAMTINGAEKLACRTPVRKELERHGRIEVAPLKNLPVIKDLVVDMNPFWGKVRDVNPWLVGHQLESTERPRGQRAVESGGVDFYNVDACIMCGACVAACTSHEVSRGFIGPAALAKADRFLEDPREPEAAKRQRLAALQGPDGMWDCVRCNFCVEVCPKDVKPMEAIIRLRRASLERDLTQAGGARHITGFCDIVRQQGRLNEALMPLKIVGFNPGRLLNVMPLGLKMLWRGKIPNPFGHAIRGIEQIRAIFATAKRGARR